MTTTYDITTSVGKVRLAIGDKDMTAPVFTDEEIQVFLAAEGSINLAAAAALEAWAATYGANVDNEHIGDYSYSQNIVTKMQNMAKQLREKEAGIPAMAWAEFDFEATSTVEMGET